jgi:hypothetical protein
MKTGFEFHPRKTWEFIESRPFYNPDFFPQWNTAEEVYDQHIANDPEILQKYTDFDWSGSEDEHPQEEAVINKRENYNRLKHNESESFPSYFDIKYAQSSKIFEAHEVIGTTPDQLQKAEETYNSLIEKLNAGEEIDEGLFGGLALAGLGALAGPTIGKAICSVLGVDPKGNLGKLLTSRLVTAALGYELGK